MRSRDVEEDRRVMLRGIDYLKGYSFHPELEEHVLSWKTAAGLGWAGGAT